MTWTEIKKKYWDDPVCSKVIAAALIGLVVWFRDYIRGAWPTIKSYFWSIIHYASESSSIPNWIILIGAIFLFLSVVVMLKRPKLWFFPLDWRHYISGRFFRMKWLWPREGSAITASSRPENLSVPRLVELKGQLNANGTLEIFARTEDGALWHIWQDPKLPGGWSNWASLGGSIDNVVVVLNRDSLLEVFGRGNDKAVCHIWQDANTYTGWSNWYSLGGPVDWFRLAQNLDGRLEVFAKWEDGTLRHKWHITNGWSSWENLEGKVDTFEACRNDDGRLEVFSQWRDGLRYHIWQETKGGAWSGWHPFGQA